MPTYKLDLTIQGLPKRYNESHSRHWSARYGEANKWKRHLAKCILAGLATKPHEPLTKARVTMIRRSSRAPDYDGLVHSFKPVMDALKFHLIIVDDKMDIIGVPTYKWEQTKSGKGHIQVIVEQA